MDRIAAGLMAAGGRARACGGAGDRHWAVTTGDRDDCGTVIVAMQDQFGAGSLNDGPEAAGVGQAARETTPVHQFRRVMDQHDAGEALGASRFQQDGQLLRLSDPIRPVAMKGALATADETPISAMPLRHRRNGNRVFSPGPASSPLIHGAQSRR